MPGRLEMAPEALPVVAIVGRPNVGKSTLFNRLVRARRAIVDNAPGVTRDRVVARASHDGRTFTCEGAIFRCFSRVGTWLVVC